VGNVVANAITSLDGYVAKQDNTIGRLFDLLQDATWHTDPRRLHRSLTDFSLTRVPTAATSRRLRDD
jgi:hypothetical protein